MVDSLCKSFAAIEKTANRWLESAMTVQNPCRLDDLVTAALYVGRAEMVVNILRAEYDNTQFQDRLSAIKIKLDNVKEGLYCCIGRNA